MKKRKLIADMHTLFISISGDMQEVAKCWAVLMHNRGFKVKGNEDMDLTDAFIDEINSVATFNSLDYFTRIADNYIIEKENQALCH